MSVRPALPRRYRPLFAAVAALAAVSGCSREGSGPVVVSVVGDRADVTKPLQRLPNPAAKLILEATAQGLVGFDASGEILPALAQRWIVEDDGRSYIFRLRRAFWPDGTRVTARDVARILLSRIVVQRRLDPDGPFDAVQSVVPMTGEVIEIKLTVARPFLLQILAQPQMAILAREGGTGPYRRAQQGQALFLTPVDRATGDDETADDEPIPPSQTRVLRAENAALAIIRFREEQAALVLGGRFADLPLLLPAGVERDAVRTDPVQGLLGLAVTGRGKLLDDDYVRAAINMAIDRASLSDLFPLSGWATSEQILPSALDLGRSPTAPAWAGQSMDERRALASATMTRWRADNGDPPPLRIALPQGPGATLIFGLLRRDLAAIGLTAVRVAINQKDADLRLIDEVAPYDSALWYLGRVGCARAVHCSDAADAALQSASLASDSDNRIAHISQAEALMQAHNGYIALGAPIRWSLVSKRLSGFQPSRRARHPLNHLFRRPN
ncbi:ABC transporter substrate-binding protein [Sphingobium sp. D43FB]|uniref:ABC transporter substrate-binding protein n=1 Tax=Sphingobium sp. D43FB TaxID=2017595 RepID=UPI000BB590A2|nr:ABC transporter substrate-binding protein [Sphingobium sp. D43FB]PBN41344.1 ABC transporter substrate-binding protein [Sphingobium sp. D43FB]